MIGTAVIFRHVGGGSQQHQLDGSVLFRGSGLAQKQAHAAILSIRDLQGANATGGGKVARDPRNVFHGTILAPANSYINGILQHEIAVVLQKIAESGGVTTLRLRAYRQIEEDK